ncbi:hypothetical protein ACFQ51_35035 [Streptomyces kaempferi]
MGRPLDHNHPRTNHRPHRPHHRPPPLAPPPRPHRRRQNPPGIRHPPLPRPHRHPHRLDRHQQRRPLRRTPPTRGVDSESEFRRYAHAPLLLVDDLGAAKSSEWTEEINFRLVNHRYENQLPTIFTSNVLPKELADRVGDRVSSRLIEMCDRVVIQGTDRRRQAAA